VPQAEDLPGRYARQVDLELADDMQRVSIGGRVYVRFDLGTESLARQWYRGVRRVFLSRFDV